MKPTGLCYERMKAKQRSRYHARKQAGLCPRCGKQPPQPGFWGCIDCRLAQSEKQTRWRCRHDRAAVVN